MNSVQQHCSVDLDRQPVRQPACHYNRCLSGAFRLHANSQPSACCCMRLADCLLCSGHPAVCVHSASGAWWDGAQRNHHTMQFVRLTVSGFLSCTGFSPSGKSTCHLSGRKDSRLVVPQQFLRPRNAHSRTWLAASIAALLLVSCRQRHRHWGGGLECPPVFWFSF